MPTLVWVSKFAFLIENLLQSHGRHNCNMEKLLHNIKIIFEIFDFWLSIYCKQSDYMVVKKWIATPTYKSVERKLQLCTLCYL